MLWRTLVSFVGGKGSIAAPPFLMEGFIIGTETTSLPFGSLGLSTFVSKAKFVGGLPLIQYLLSPRDVHRRRELVTSWVVLFSFGEARILFAGGDPDSCLVLPASSGSMMASMSLSLFQIKERGKKEEEEEEEVPKVEGNLPLLTSLLARALHVLSPIAPY